jgi:hypothetical protein
MMVQMLRQETERLKQFSEQALISLKLVLHTVSQGNPFGVTRLGHAIVSW